MFVREYGHADHDACAALHEELLETHRRLYPDAQIGGEFVPEGRLFVAEDDGRVLGYVGLLWHGRRAELEPIVVAPGARDRGVGRALAERVVDEARAAGAIHVFVRPAARNREAIDLYHELGFDVVGYFSCSSTSSLASDTEPS